MTKDVRFMHSLSSRFTCTLLILTALVVLTGCTLVTLDVHGALAINLQSSGSSTPNIGTITVDGTTYSLSNVIGIGAGLHSIRYNPAAGWVFVRWESSGPVTVSDVNAQSTQLTVAGSDGVLTAVYGSAPATVGGVVLPYNPLTVLAPYLTAIDLVAVAATVYVTKRR